MATSIAPPVLAFLNSVSCPLPTVRCSLYAVRTARHGPGAHALDRLMLHHFNGTAIRESSSPCSRPVSASRSRRSCRSSPPAFWSGTRIPRLNRWYIMLPVVMAGVVIGDGFLYSIGRIWGRKTSRPRVGSAELRAAGEAGARSRRTSPIAGSWSCSARGFFPASGRRSSSWPACCACRSDVPARRRDLRDPDS